jgi:hypothetical protein
MVEVIRAKIRIENTLPVDSFQGWMGMVLSFLKSPLCLSCAIPAGRLVIPDIIIEKVTIDNVTLPLASATNSSGTPLKKTKTPSRSQSIGQAITQKRAALLMKLSFIPLENAAEI